MRRALPFVAVLSLLVMTMAAASAAYSPQVRSSYIVVLQPGTTDVPAVAAGLARANGGEVGFVYQHALQGFSVTIAPQGAAALARNPQVAYVEADTLQSIAAQDLPTGIQRIFADDNTNLDIDGSDDYRVDVDVAVIDTGVDFQHPDLDVVGGVNCASGGPFGGSCGTGGDDDHYHGTHVAGTIGALDNGLGVVGVAPGARIWAVKVLNQRGSGYTSWIIAGIDWVAANADTIEVANMSLGGSGYSQAEYNAIQGAVNKGVAFAVAAGNDDDDAANHSPAAFDNVLTVSALADFNGAPGGGAASTCRSDVDDTLADFSNWGSAVDIAAPGVCILSTFPLEQGEYGTISGTSMASPHAAGALALLASRNNPNNASNVDALYDQVTSAGNLNWTDDSRDGVHERLLDVSNTTLFKPTLVAGGGGGNQTPTASFTWSCTDLACSFNGSGSSDPDGSISSYAWTFGDGATDSGVSVNHTYGSTGSHTVRLTVTDNQGATASTSHSVTVGSSTGSLSATSTSQGKTWTAIVTGTTGGTFSPADGTTTCASDGCSLSGIPKKTGSVTFTETGTGRSIVVLKP